MNRISLGTQVQVETKPLLSHEHKVITVGSCFSENLGQKLLRYKWDALVNPFGTLFHPLAIFQVLRMSFSQEDLPGEGFVEADGAWFHLALPKTFYAPSPSLLQKRFTEHAETVKTYCQSKPSCLLLTLGTAQVYVDKVSGIVAANCHKLPSQRFEKRLLTLQEITEAWRTLSVYIPDSMVVMWTLSPVRHLRETLTVNSVSKSLLRVWLQDHLQDTKTSEDYFPAFEIIMDELRDYRFYAEDFLHPNLLAIDYLWDIFLQYRVTSPAKAFCQDWARILQRLEHRPLHMNAPSWKVFLQETRTLLEKLEGVDVRAELQLVDKNLRDISKI